MPYAFYQIIRTSGYGRSSGLLAYSRISVLFTFFINKNVDFNFKKCRWLLQQNCRLKPRTLPDRTVLWYCSGGEQYQRTVPRNSAKRTDHRNSPPWYCSRRRFFMSPCRHGNPAMIMQESSLTDNDVVFGRRGVPTIGTRHFYTMLVHPLVPYFTSLNIPWQQVMVASTIEQWIAIGGRFFTTLPEPSPANYVMLVTEPQAYLYHLFASLKKKSENKKTHLKQHPTAQINLMPSILFRLFCQHVTTAPGQSWLSNS